MDCLLLPQCRKTKGAKGGGGGGEGIEDAQVASSWVHWPVLGVGRVNTTVYKASYLVHTAQRRNLCIWYYNANEPKCGQYTEHEIDEDLAVKDIPRRDQADAVVECKIHEALHQWFTKANRLSVTSLHPIVKWADLDRSDGSKHRLIMLRLFQGDVARIRMRVIDLVAMAESVLMALVVLHKNDFLHTDIKPNNILYQEDADGTRTYALSDFGLLLTSDAVINNLIDGGWPNGTDGYISPLLLITPDNYTTDRFENVALSAGVFAVPPRDWDVFFQQQQNRLKQPSHHNMVFKTDLHSLALTMYTLMLINNIESATLMGFLGRLMFFNKKEGIFTAATALRVLRRLKGMNEFY